MSIINKILEGLAHLSESSKEITPNLHVLEFRIVNAFIVNDFHKQPTNWVLIDTGLENSAN